MLSITRSNDALLALQWTMAAHTPRMRPSSASSTTAFGGYTPEKEKLMRTSPSFTFGTRAATTKDHEEHVKAKGTTDPHKYKPDRMHTMKTAPAYSMGERTSPAALSERRASTWEKGRDSPGPGAYYPTTGMAATSSASPRYTIGEQRLHGTAGALKKSVNRNPGPGAYFSAGAASPRATVVNSEPSRTGASSSMAANSKQWATSVARAATSARMGRVEHRC